MAVIIVLGAPGAGKTTVLTKAAEQSPGWRVITWGDRALEIAKAKGLAKERDEIRKLPVAKQAELQRMVADSLANEKGKWMLDTHCSINTPEGYYPGLPFKVLEKLKADALAYVNAPVEDVMRRRKTDTSRARDAQGRKELEEHLAVNRALLGAYSAFSGAPVMIIENADGKLDEAVAKLKGLLR